MRYQIERGAAVGGIARDFEIALGGEQCGQRAAHHGLIFGNEDADHTGHPNAQQRAVRAIAFQDAAERFHAFAHAAQAAAVFGAPPRPLSAIFQFAKGAVAAQREAAAGGLGMAHDIGDGFAQGEGEDALLHGGEAAAVRPRASTVMPAVSSVARACLSSPSKPIER